jgi:hypothetical protein
MWVGWRVADVPMGRVGLEKRGNAVMKRFRAASVLLLVALVCLWPLLAACGTLEIRIERTPAAQPTATPTPSPLPPFPNACQEYLALLVSTEHTQQPAVATAYECRGLSVDSTGQAPSRAPALALDRGGLLRLEPGAVAPPTAIEVRLYPGAGAAASFMRWPEELPGETEPVDRAELKIAGPITYAPQAASGTYSLVIRIRWPEGIDVFYAITFALEAADTPGPTPTGSASTPSPVPDGLPAGLVYQLENALWLVDADGRLTDVSDNPGATLSPDGRQLISYNAPDGEYWLYDRASGEETNLTRTPQRLECCFRWWPERPDVVLFSSIDPATVGRAPGSIGFLSAVNRDGTAYRVLDDEHDVFVSEIAPSSDGQTIAYGGGSTGWLYHWEAGTEAFDPLAYGLTGVGSPEIGSPAWSPDGTRLAWVVGGQFGEDTARRYAVVIFDLAARTTRLLHPYTPVQRGPWPPAAAWSPDGRWLAFVAWAEKADEEGVWVVQVDGAREEEYYLGQGDQPVWSPDGVWLAFNHAQRGVEIGIHLAQAGTWESKPLDLAPDAYLVGWIEVAASATPEATPVAPPTSTPEATEPSVKPEIASFGVIPGEAEPGDVITLIWEAKGDRATLCPTSHFVLFTQADCQQVPLSGSTTFALPQEAKGNSYIDWILRVEGEGSAEPAIWQTSVALKCERTWFFSDEPQAGICPREPVETYAAIQRFQRGTMIWLQASGRYVILEETPTGEEDTQGRVTYVSDPLDIVEDTSADVEAPEGLYAPVSGFGLLWRGDVRGVPGYREQLSWALAPEFGYDATLQCDDALPSGGRSWQTCYLEGPEGEAYVLDPLDRWYVWAQSGIE